MAPEAQETFVITRGLEGCLFVYPLDEWNRIEKKLRNLSMTQQSNRFFVRMLTSHAVEVAYDKQGRIPIPSYLAELANIEKDVLIIGALERIEIWSPKVYNEYVNGNSETFESVAEKIILEKDAGE